MCMYRLEYMYLCILYNRHRMQKQNVSWKKLKCVLMYNCIKLFLGGNNLVFSRPERVWSVTSRLGTRKWLTLFYSVPNWDTRCQNADAGGIDLDADAQLWIHNIVLMTKLLLPIKKHIIDMRVIKWLTFFVLVHQGVVSAEPLFRKLPAVSADPSFRNWTKNKWPF